MPRTSSRMFLLNSWPTRTSRSLIAVIRARVAVILVHARAAEVAPDLLQQPDRVGVQTGGLEPGEDLVELAVQAQPVELLDLLDRGLTGAA